MHDLLSPTFWQQHVDRLVSWAVTSIPAMALILVLGWLAMRALHPLLGRVTAVFVARAQARQGENGEVEKRIETLAQILRSTLKLLIGFMVVLLLLRQVGVDIAPLIAGAGIVGLAVGFGAQNLVRDVISGFFILLEDQIRVGDVAVINGTGGLVEAVGLRTIVLRDQRGVVHVFPNGGINLVSNMTKDWSAYVFDIGVSYGADVDRVIEVIRSVGDDLQRDPRIGAWILEPIEVLGVENFADSAVVIRARFKTVPRQQWDVAREFNRRLKKRFDAEGIEIPFPQRTVQLIQPAPKPPRS